MDAILVVSQVGFSVQVCDALDFFLHEGRRQFRARLSSPVFRLPFLSIFFFLLVRCPVVNVRPALSPRFFLR